MAEIEAQVVQVPGEVAGARVVGWKCDHCEQTHVSLSLLVLSEDGGEPLVLSVQANETVARKLAELIPQELEHPAPGTEGGLELPIPSTWETGDDGSLN